MKLIRILLWALIVINGIEAVTAFCVGDIAHGIKVVSLIPLFFMTISYNYEVEEKGKLIALIKKTLSEVEEFCTSEIKERQMNDVRNMRGRYMYTEMPDGYMVRFQPDVLHQHAIPIKFIPFGDDKAYALLCVTELIEKLNESI